jgi:hypothetical protein
MIYEIPPALKRFEIVKGKGGDYLVVSETTGQGGVAIPVSDLAKAEVLCDRLNRGQHDGRVEVE